MSGVRGITLISLIITVILLAMLSGTTIYVGTDVIESVKVKAFVTEMQVIQAKVNIIHEEMKNGNVEYKNLGEQIDILSDDLKQRINIAMQGEAVEGFKYFNSSDLEKLNITNLKQEVVINFTTRDVISINGVKKDGKMHYTQYNLPGGQKNIINEYDNTEKPKFTIDKQIFGLSANIIIKDIEYSKNMRKTGMFIMQK